LHESNQKQKLFLICGEKLDNFLSFLFQVLFENTEKTFERRTVGFCEGRLSEEFAVWRHN
jgi:hypothetical protein